MAIASKNVVSRETTNFLLTFMQKNKRKRNKKAKESNEDGDYNKKALLLRKTSTKELHLRSNKERREGMGTKKRKLPKIRLSAWHYFFIKNLLEEVKNIKKR